MDDTVYLGTYRVFKGFKIIPARLDGDERKTIIERFQSCSFPSSEAREVAIEVLTAFCADLTKEKATELVDSEEVSLIDLIEIVKACVSPEWDGEVEKRPDALELKIRPLGFGKRSERIVEILSGWKDKTDGVSREEIVELISLASGLPQEAIKPYVDRGYATIDVIEEITNRLCVQPDEDSKKN